MAILNKFTLKINDPVIAKLYRRSYTGRIFSCGIAITILRLALTLYSWVLVSKNPTKYKNSIPDTYIINSIILIM